MVHFTLAACTLRNGDTVDFRTNTAIYNTHRLVFSINGGVWQDWNPENPPPNDGDLRLAMWHGAVPSWRALPQPRHGYNNAEDLAHILLTDLLANLLPGGPANCPHCNNAGMAGGNPVCEAYMFYPTYLMTCLAYMHNGSGPGNADWNFPNQSWIVLRDTYAIHTAAAHGSPYYRSGIWLLYRGWNVGPTCVIDCIRRLCDYNIRCTQFGTMPRP